MFKGRSGTLPSVARDMVITALGAVKQQSRICLSLSKNVKKMLRSRESQREMISNTSSYAAALGTAQFKDDAEPAVEDTAAASNKVAEGETKDLSETGSSDADSSSQCEGEFTMKTNSPLSSAMTLVLNSSGSCSRSGGPLSGEGKGKGKGGAGWRVGRVGGARAACAW